MTDIIMPSLSEAMEEGTILRWLKRQAERVELGDELVEVETDKATVTVESPACGVLDILTPEGTTVSVGAPIARLGADAGVPSEAPVADAEELSVELPQRPGLAPKLAEYAASTDGAKRSPAARTTPLARRIAVDHGVDLGEIHGTGPRGRITRNDVLSVVAPDQPSPRQPALATVANDPAPPAPAPPPTANGTPGGTASRELTRVQQVIARRTAETKATVPDFQVSTEAVVDSLLSLRAQLKTADTAPSVNDFIVKAAALALREFPLVNGSYCDGHLVLHPRVNIGIAVAAEEVLIVPTIADADIRSLRSIAAESRTLADAARAGTITPPQLAGATFTVSNLGMYGMTAITPIINAPQAAILGVGAARPHLTRVEGEIVERRLITLTLSCDHRILYGAEAARFLSRVRELLEQPLLLAF
jgi:pyruvate dehydrogenase E2 component (dihydrolipoamide acetyltransferase)